MVDLSRNQEGQEQRRTASNRRRILTHAVLGRVEDAGAYDGTRIDRLRCHVRCVKSASVRRCSQVDLHMPSLQGANRRANCQDSAGACEERERHVVRSVEGWFHKSWCCVPCIHFPTRWTYQRIVPWRRLLRVGMTEANWRNSQR